MTTTIKYDGLTLTGNGNMVNFPGGFGTVMNTPVSVINTPSRSVAIVIQDALNSSQFAGTYTIIGGTDPTFPQRAVYNNIKGKEGAAPRILIFNEGEANEVSIDNVTLRSVSNASELGGGALRCNLIFELVASNV